MENKVLSIFLGGLIAAIIFHALASRYEIHTIQRDYETVYRIDRLTGRLWSCDMRATGLVGEACYGGGYNDTQPMQLPEK